MLNALIDWSLRWRFLVLALAGLLVLAGAVALRHLPVDAFPDTTPVQVQINAIAPALSPLEVEQQITFPVEQAIGGLAGLTEVRSLSRFGLSQVTVIFDDDVDIYLARQLVNERLAAVELPPALDRPQLGPVATGLGEVFHYIVTSPTRDLAELRTIQDWQIRPRLRSVPGVAEVNSWGGLERQYHVLVDPQRLIKYGLTLGDLTEALQRNNRNAGGGVVTRAGESLLVQGVGVLDSPQAVESVVVAAHDGVPVCIRDVARVGEGHATRHGAVTFAGQGEAVLGLGFMLMGQNSREVTHRLKQRLAEITPSLPPDVQVIPVYDRTELVDHVLATVRTNLFEGALLVIAVLFLFLGNLRAGLIVALAIPLSMLAAGCLMLRAGIAGSLMSLGAIDFGLIVDSSVIQIENAMRRLAADDARRPRLDVVREAALEVRRPTMFGELIIMIVYLPILALEGIEGRLFRPMALTVVFALAGSLVLSLTLMPALASLALPRRPAHREPRALRLAAALYAPALRFTLRRRASVLVSAAALLLALGIWPATRLGAVFIPRLSEEAIVINTVRLAGISVDETLRYGTQIERLLLSRFPDEIRHIWSRTGTAEVATDPMGLELTDVFITLQPRSRWKRARSQPELVAQMQDELAGMPAMRTIFAQPIELRVNEMIAGIRSDLGVKIFGDDFDALADAGQRIADLLRSIPGAADVAVEQLTGQPTLEIRVRREQLARYGVTADDVLTVVEALDGLAAGEVRDGSLRVPLTVRLPDAYRNDPQRVARLLVPTADGQQLPLAQLADVRIVQAPATINREWGKRRLVVQCNARGRDIAGLVAEARRRIASEVRLPPGFFVSYSGQFEHLERGSRRLAIVVPLALALILLLLYLTYRRLADVLLIALTLPFAAVGGIAALYLRGLPFSISAGVGFVAMSGVSVLGHMVFVSFFRGLLEQGVPWHAAIEHAARTRLRPVLMTGLVAGLGFVPMAFNTGVGAEVQRPLATVVIGSVLTSMFLTLLVLPAAYALIGPRAASQPPPSPR